MNTINRRDTFIAILGLGIAARRSVHGQQPRRVALFLAPLGSRDNFTDVFRAGMREQGWTEGRDFQLDVFLTSDSSAGTDAVVRKIIASSPAVIVASGGAVVTPLHRIGTTLPVVFALSGDPVDAGLVNSFSRPGGNFTGICWMSLTLVGKRLELLREILPRLRRVAVFADPLHAGERKEWAASDEAARVLGLELRYFAVRSPAGLGEALISARGQYCEALDVYPDGFTLRHRVEIAEFAKAEKLMSISGWLDYAEAGFLASYGVNRTETIRRLASYASRILRGALPADLPVELPTIVESAVNLTTAKALGLTIPRSVLTRADRVIE